MKWVTVLTAGWLLAGTAQAYDPPVATAGPITVRLQEPRRGFYGQFGPDHITQPGVPVTVPVSLQNSDDNPVRGMVQLRVSDRWRVEPSGLVPFEVRPRGRVRLDFAVSAGEGTFNAHYPVHAVVEFEHKGRRLAAHAVLVLEPRFPNPPRAKPAIDWKPVEAPAEGAMGLWRLPVRRVLMKVFAEEVQLEAWRRRPRRDWGETNGENFEISPTVQYGVRVQRGQWREGVSIQVGARAPSRRERVQMALVEYPISLPKTQPIHLRFASALGDGRERGEAVTFCVRVLPFDAPPGQEGTVVFERPTESRVWEDAEVDLTRFAGRNVRLQLQSRDGPGNANVQSYWAEPTLLFGSLSAPSVFPPPANASSRSLGTLAANGTTYEARVWLGKRGLLDGAIGFVDGNRRLLFHGFRVRVLGDPLHEWRSTSELLEVREESANGRHRVRHRFRSWAGPFDMVSELWIESGALRVRFFLENEPPPRPWFHMHLENVATGPWSERARRVYCGVGNVIQDPQAFQLGFGGQTLASSFVGFDFANGVSLVQGVDVPPDRLEVDPEAGIYTLSTPHAQTLTFILSGNVWQAVKVWREVNGLRPAGGVAKLAGRFVFDLWRGAYSESAKALQAAFRYGLTDAAVVWHRWQRWGYDVRLPDIYPPNTESGSFEDFISLVSACRNHGVLFAPHDNYVDFYPDAEGFTYENIVFNSDSIPVRAWLNASRQAQSYRWRPDRVRPFLERNLRLIREGFGPTAYFIDVWSSLGPYDYWTRDGQFFDRTQTRRAWGESFAWIRDFLGDQAPQISEAGHDQLIGWLDGGQVQHARVEAPPEPIWRLRVIPVRCADAERIPWFDAAHHDRFIYHGAGYTGRYASGQDARLHGIYSDDYITTEALTGHPAMVSEPFSRDVVRKYWLLHDFSRGLALRRLDSLEFADGNLHRQSVRWDNGAQVYVNRGAEDWKVGEHLLPQYGFYARVPLKDGQVETAIERRGGVIVEWSKSPALIYLNARPLVLEGSSREDADAADPRAARMNPEGKLVAFGAATTNGAFRLAPDDDALRLTPLPSSPGFLVRLRWNALPWKVSEPKEAEALDENGSLLRRVALQREAGEVVLECEPDVFVYRLR